MCHAQVPIVLVHEQDAACGGCPFGLFFRTTPDDLINEHKLYGPVAVAWHPGPYRDVSVRLLAEALGARRGGRSWCEGAMRGCTPRLALGRALADWLSSRARTGQGSDGMGGRLVSDGGTVLEPDHAATEEAMGLELADGRVAMASKKV